MRAFIRRGNGQPTYPITQFTLSLQHTKVPIQLSSSGKSVTMFSRYAPSLFITSALATYSIVDDYTQGSFADRFNFFTGNDPTNGYVNYIDYPTAQSSGLYKQSDSNVYIGVDRNNTATGRGRNSVRIESKKSYQHGLIILDLAHMPGGACGTWPAFWLLSTSAEWPKGGEVDIIEGVNGQKVNTMAVHTNAGCSISNNGGMSGQIMTSNCDVAAPNQATNQGCAINSANTATYGSGFNSNGGGVYATEWTSEGISIYFFPRSSIPSDITSGKPDPSGWGLPIGRFEGACDWDEKVVNQQIIFDVTFCGDWAGGVFSSDAICSSKASTCQSFVQNNPNAFTDTYWSVNSLKVFQQNGQATPTSTVIRSTTSSSISRFTTTSSTTTQVTTSTFVTLTSSKFSTTSTFTSTASISSTLFSATTTSSTQILSSTSSATTTLYSTTTTPYPTTASFYSTTPISSSQVVSSTSSTTTTFSTSVVSSTTSTTIVATTTAYSTPQVSSSSHSSWQGWSTATISSAPYIAPTPSTIWTNPPASTFYTITKPWNGTPNGSPNSWGPSGNGPWGSNPGGSGPGNWGGRPPKA